MGCRSDSCSSSARSRAVAFVTRRLARPSRPSAASSRRFVSATPPICAATKSTVRRVDSKRRLAPLHGSPRCHKHRQKHRHRHRYEAQAHQAHRHRHRHRHKHKHTQASCAGWVAVGRRGSLERAACRCFPVVEASCGCCSVEQSVRRGWVAANRCGSLEQAVCWCFPVVACAAAGWCCPVGRAASRCSVAACGCDTHVGCAVRRCFLTICCGRGCEGVLHPYTVVHRRIASCAVRRDWVAAIRRGSLERAACWCLNFPMVEGASCRCACRGWVAASRCVSLERAAWWCSPMVAA